MTAEQDDDAPRGRRRQVVFGALGAVLILGVVSLLVIGLIANKTSTALDDAILAGKPRPAPDFTLPLLANAAAINRKDGAELALRELRGHPVVLNFWASWCDPCRREAPRLDQAWRSHRGDGVVVLGLDNQDLSEKALAFIRRYKQAYPSVREGGDGNYRAYGLTGLPETFFIDAQGLVRAHVIGEISTRQLEEGIALASVAADRKQ